MSLKEVRKKAGLSQSQLAELSGVNFRMLQYYEQGTKDINKAQLYTLLSICDTLNCGLGDLITDSEILELIDKLNL